MKWFHHDVDSHKDPFIEWLLDNITKGYQSFFIILEMMSEQYRPKTIEDSKTPIVLRLKTIMASTRINKKEDINKLLDACATHPLNKKPWFVNHLDGKRAGYVELFSPKLTDDADDYTKKCLKKEKNKAGGKGC